MAIFQDVNGIIKITIHLLSRFYGVEYNYIKVPFTQYSSDLSIHPQGYDLSNFAGGQHALGAGRGQIEILGS